MTIMVENLDGVEAWTGSAGQAIPAGEHVTEIEDLEEGKTSNQNPQVIITWRVVDGPYRDATSREWFVVTPQAAGKVRAFLEAVQYTIPEGDFAFPTTELRGRRARTVWREDSYGGKTSIKCMAHGPVPAVGGGGDVPIDSADLPKPAADGNDDEPLPF